MLTIPKKNGTGELLPRLEKILTGRGISVGRINACGAHVGWVTKGAVFVAKTKLWNNQVSTQKDLVTRCIQDAKWICFWIPGSLGKPSSMIRFDPKRFLEKGWKNMRDSEEMINIDVKYGTFLGGDQLDMEPPVKPSEQLIISLTEKRDPPKVANMEELKEWRQKLGAIMSRYAEVFQWPVDKVETDLYRRLRVGSRTELSTDQLRREFLSYQTAIKNQIA